MINRNIIKSIIAIFIFLSLSLTGFSYTQSLRVSLLTQDPGDEMYAYFGHTALRIKDDSLRIDLVYNYGTFDFNTPNFYLKFLRGDLDYCLSIDDFDYFVYASYETKRTIHEQELLLTFEEKVEIAQLLETCYTTDARYYRYDFLKNNCATKIRDIIEDATGNRIDFNKSSYSGKTFRELLEPFVAKNYWINFGINLGMGMETDKLASPSDYMFLPIYIHDFFESSDFAKDSFVLLNASPEAKSGFNYSYLSPWIIVLVLIGLSFWSKSRKIILYIICIAFGLTGILLLFLDLYSLHAAIGNNLNTLCTLPAFLILFFRKKKLNEYFKITYITIIALFIALQGVLPQSI
ncbi:MAG: hypothetical protein C0596_11205 [Marinilabiliales bacterium]|nr:MAG: hypothetical protein C0596_11205 [Marinilabiliales bacterium]